MNLLKSGWILILISLAGKINERKLKVNSYQNDVSAIFDQFKILKKYFIEVVINDLMKYLLFFN